MKVYEDDEKPDKYGNYPLRLKGYKNLEEVNQYLWNHYQGYHFVIILDETKDEDFEIGKELLVYFTDTVLEELAFVCDMKVVKR